MTTPTPPSIVPLFLGEDIVDIGEGRLVPRLRADLERRGIVATLYANVLAGRRGRQRQVDLVVRTPTRVVVCEIKSFDRRLPVVARTNGPWKQILDDGTPFVHDGNAADQAKQAAFAVSDTMRALARVGRVSPAVGGGRFLRHFDTVVCMFERIPAGSEIDQQDHVDVIDYAGLVELVCSERTSGTLNWTDAEWDIWVRELGLYQDGGPVEKAMRRAGELPEIGRARARFVTALQSALPERVPTSLLGPGTARTDIVALIDELRTGGDIVLRGRSGAGKTLLADHLAVELTEMGRLVAKVRCGDYRGRLSALLARAFAPYSTANIVEELMPSAVDAGVGITLVLDEYDKCPVELTSQLEDNLLALRLRTGCSFLVTTTGPAPSGLAQNAAFELLAPTRDERSAILSAYGARRPELLVDVFDTPFELSIAAAAENDLRAGATPVELFDAYVRKLVTTERERSRLRQFAWLLHEQLVPSMPIIDVTARWANDRASPEDIDSLLGSKLLTTETNRVRFRHEMLQRFLTAESIAREMSGPDVGRFLTAPPNRSLAPWTIPLLVNEDDRWEAVAELCDVELLTDALAGQLGRRVQQRGSARLSQALTAARTLTQHATLQPPTSPDSPFARWVAKGEVDELDACLISAAGIELGHGRLSPAVVDLIDATDKRCQEVALELEALGFENPISAAVGSAYVIAHSLGRLPSQLLVDGARSTSWRGQREPDVGIVGKLLKGAGPFAPGRYLLAAELANPHDREDAEALPELIRRGWEQRAYHVRLEILETAQRFAGTPDPAREAIVNELDAINPEKESIFINSALVDALSSFGRIEPMASLVDIQDRIARLLEHPDDAGTHEVAATMVDNQFENEGVIGPYGEAIDALAPEDRVNFFCLAARSTASRMWSSWTIGQLANLAEEVPTHREQIRSAIERYAVQPDPGSWMPSEATAAWAAAVRGMATCTADSPEEWVQDDTVWADLGRTLHSVHRGQAAVTSRSLVGYGAEAVKALNDLSQAQMHNRRDTCAFEIIQETRSEDVRDLLVWALQHPEAFESPRDSHLHRFAIATLARVGGADDVEVLAEWTLDPELGAAAADAIVSIRRSAGS